MGGQDEADRETGCGGFNLVGRPLQVFLAENLPVGRRAADEETGCGGFNLVYRLLQVFLSGKLEAGGIEDVE